jgi:hypothetical protein
VRILPAIFPILMFAASALAAGSAPPADFAGVALGTPLRELKHRYPDISRNPDSDRGFQVYQVAALKGVSEKSPAAFSISKGRVVGGQVLLDQHNAEYWLKSMIDKYGQPDSCTYCYDPTLARASWTWSNGTTLKIDGEMLTELTSEGEAARQAWLERATTEVADADNGDEDSDLGESPAHSSSASGHHQGKRRRIAEPASAPAHRRSPTWTSIYNSGKDRMKHWFGY